MLKKKSETRNSTQKLLNNAVFKEGNKLYKVVNRFTDLGNGEEEKCI